MAAGCSWPAQGRLLDHASTWLTSRDVSALSLCLQKPNLKRPNLHMGVSKIQTFTGPGIRVQRLDFHLSTLHSSQPSPVSAANSHGLSQTLLSAHLKHWPSTKRKSPPTAFGGSALRGLAGGNGHRSENGAAKSGPLVAVQNRRRARRGAAGAVKAGDGNGIPGDVLDDQKVPREASPALDHAGESRTVWRDGVSVHPTALVHPDAVLMEDVEVGPFCTVGPLVRLGKGCKLYSNCHIAGDTVLGDNCVLFTGAVVGSDLPGWTRIGSHNQFGHYSLVGIRCQDLKYKEGSPCFLKLESHNDIREHTQIHRSSKPDDCTEIGSHNLIMGACHVAHDCKIGNRNILANNTLLAGHVVLQNFIHTGGAVAVHQFCHVDSYSFLAGGSMVTRDVPMYTMVCGDRAELRGLNLEGLRRCGFTTEEVRDIRKAYQKLFMNTDSQLGFEERLASVEESELGQQPRVKLFLESIRGSFQDSRRGICRFRHWSAADGV